MRAGQEAQYAGKPRRPGIAGRGITDHRTLVASPRKAEFMPELTGLLAFPLTPFTDDLELNLDAFADHVEGHVAAGAGALFVGCGTGEFSALAPDELAALLRTAREVVNGRVPIWVGAGGGAAAAK